MGIDLKNYVEQMALKAYAPHTFGTIADWKTSNRHRAIGRGKNST